MRVLGSEFSSNRRRRVNRNELLRRTSDLHIPANQFPASRHQPVGSSSRQASVVFGLEAESDYPNGNRDRQADGPRSSTSRGLHIRAAVYVVYGANQEADQSAGYRENLSASHGR